MRMTVNFEGGKDLSRGLRALGDESTKVGRRSLRQTANLLRDELIAAAPRNPAGATEKSKRLKDGSVARYRYGQLFQNIRVRELRVRMDNTIGMVVSTGNAFWGNFLEFGTRKMAARPWFRPVWDRMQNRLIAELGQVLGKNIEGAARRQARRVLPNGRNG